MDAATGECGSNGGQDAVSGGIGTDAPDGHVGSCRVETFEPSTQRMHAEVGLLSTSLPTSDMLGFKLATK